MKVNINRDNIVNDYATRDIVGVNIEEFGEIVLCIKSRLEILEEKLEEYKESDNEKLREYIPRKEKEILQLQNILKLMQ
jgi:polyhydroxyalkanoate synthesis regulator phasin